MRKALLRRLGSSLLTLALAALAAALLLRLAPGFDVDAAEIDGRTSDETRAQLRADLAQQQDVGRYLSSALRGDLGQSRTYAVPVTGLIAERLPTTLRLIALGLAGAWALALLLALVNVVWPQTDPGFHLFNATLLAAPAGLVALLILLAQRPASLGLTIALLPRLFSYARGLFRQHSASAYAFAAQARGLSPWLYLSRYIVWPAGPSLLAILGLSVNTAIGGAILLETICDIPGVGQLAIQAALGRDLPLLVGMTLIVGLLTISANTLTDLAAELLLRARGHA